MKKINLLTVGSLLAALAIVSHTLLANSDWLSNPVPADLAAQSSGWPQTYVAAGDARHR